MQIPRVIIQFLILALQRNLNRFLPIFSMTLGNNFKNPNVGDTISKNGSPCLSLALPDYFLLVLHLE